jgi:4-amino-4-deoxy-L-arabinose transferase-like glycosyltransferase
MSDIAFFHAGILGIGLYTAVVGGGLCLLLIAASRSGLLAAVLLGLLLRAVVMLLAQLLSHNGLFYVDDGGYVREGSLIAHEWLRGHFVNPSSYQYAGSLAFGYQLTVACITVLVGKSLIAVKLVNVLLGSAMVLLVGLLARRLFDGKGGPAAAWLMALIPTSIWWSAVALKEALVAFLAVGALLALTYLPKRRAAIALGLAFVVLAVTRSTAVVALAGMIVVLLGAAWRKRGSAVWPGALARPLGIIAAIGLAGVLAVSGGHPLNVLAQIGHTLSRMGLERHQGLGSVVAAVPKSLVSPYPWVFTKATLTWDRALYPGMWVWYALLPTAAFGAWRLRRSAIGLMLVLPVITLLTTNAFTAGFTFRQRSTVEPLLVLLVVAGADSCRRMAFRAAGAYAVLAPLVYAQSRSVSTAGLVTLAAVVMGLLARRLPASVTLRVSLSHGLATRLLDGVLAGSPPRPLAALRRGTVAFRAAAPPSTRQSATRLLGAVLAGSPPRPLAALRRGTVAFRAAAPPSTRQSAHSLGPAMQKPRPLAAVQRAAPALLPAHRHLNRHAAVLIRAARRLAPVEAAATASAEMWSSEDAGPYTLPQ